MGEDLEIIDRKPKEPVCIPYKIELADVELEKLLKEMPNLLEQLRKEDYYLIDLDMMQDFAAGFCRNF